MSCRLLLGGVLAAFYVLAVLAIRQLSYEAVKEAVFIRPNYGWCFAMGSALLWLVTGLFACCENFLPLLSHRPSPLTKHPCLSSRMSSSSLQHACSSTNKY